MKIILNAIVLMTSFNAMAETDTISTRRNCYNSYESTIKNFIVNQVQTQKCAVQDAKLFGEIECEQKNGRVEEQIIAQLTCDTKIYDYMDKRHNRTTCTAVVKSTCSLK